MVAGLIVLAAVLAAASAAGVGIRVRSGRFRPRTSLPGQSRTTATQGGSGQAQSPAGDPLTAADLGAALGERATLVQFSTEFCRYCGPARELLAEVAGARDGVALIEVDAARRLDLARRLNVLSTPTILVLGPDGSIAQRASGLPRKSDVLAALGGVLGGGAS